MMAAPIGGKADDQRDHLQVLRLAQQADRFRAADALLLAGLGDALELHAGPAQDDDDDDQRRRPAWPR